jgi:hypothetical protein
MKKMKKLATLLLLSSGSIGLFSCNSQNDEGRYILKYNNGDYFEYFSVFDSKEAVLYISTKDENDEVVLLSINTLTGERKLINAYFLGKSLVKMIKPEDYVPEPIEDAAAAAVATETAPSE